MIKHSLLLNESMITFSSHRLFQFSIHHSLILFSYVVCCISVIGFSDIHRLHSVLWPYCFCVSLSYEGYIVSHAFQCSYGSSGCSLPLFQVYAWHSWTPCMYMYVCIKREREIGRINR